MAFKSLSPGTDPLNTDIQQIIAALTGLHDVGPISLAGVIAAPGAPTVAVNATAGLLNGAYTYKVTLVTGYVDSDGTMHLQGETPGGTTSASVAPVSQKVDLTAIPTGAAGTAAVARRIYRTAAGGADGTQKLVVTINDNVTTSYTDNLADASLGAVVPTGNTTGTYHAAEELYRQDAPGAGAYKVLRRLQQGLASPADKFREVLDSSGNLIIQRWTGAAWADVATYSVSTGQITVAGTLLASILQTSVAAGTTPVQVPNHASNPTDAVYGIDMVNGKLVVNANGTVKQLATLDDAAAFGIIL
ncbi:MAG TPA: hypothetical protein VGL40_06935 [Bacillota bacterium]|jgi:hypothetical protein